MNWFDELSVALAKKSVPRRTALTNVARVAASAFLFPWASTATAALAQTAPPLSRGSGFPARRVRPVLGVPALRPAKLPLTTRIGPCTHRFNSRGSALTYSTSSSAGGGALSLTIEQQSVVQRGAGGGATLFGGTSTITVTSGGDQVVRIATTLRPTAAGAPASGNVSVTYGPLVRGLSSASLTIDRGSIGGTVGGRRLVPMSARPGVAPEQVRFADARAFPRVQLDPGLRDGIAALFDRAKTRLRLDAADLLRARIDLLRRIVLPAGSGVLARRHVRHVPARADQLRRNGLLRSGQGMPQRKVLRLSVRRRLLHERRGVQSSERHVRVRWHLRRAEPGGIVASELAAGTDAISRSSGRKKTGPLHGRAESGSVGPAQVAELVDALVSGISPRKGVEVRVLSWAPRRKARHINERCAGLLTSRSNHAASVRSREQFPEHSASAPV